MTITRRLATAALPAAGLAVVAGALAFTGQAASAAPLADTGDAPTDGAKATVLDAVGQVGELAQQVTAQLPVGGQGSPLASLIAADPAAQADQGRGERRGDAADLPAAAKFGSGVTTIATGHNAGILNGTQIYAPVQLDVDVCGNSIAIAGSVAFGSCGDADLDEPPGPPTDEEPPVPPTDEEPPVPPTDEEPPPVPLPNPGTDVPVAQPELPRTGLPVGALAGVGGLITAGGAAMQMVGVRGGGYVGRHRR